MTKNHYDVVVIGGGISGTALFYELAHYTNIKKIALLEKYEGVAKLNSKGTSNSQTIHCGDIETNYTIDKARDVKKTAKMIENYCLLHKYDNKFMFKGQKMAIGIGDEEVDFMTNRYDEFSELYPYLEVYDKKKLKEIEPAVIFDENGLERKEDVVGVGASSEYSTVDFGAMAESFVNNTLKIRNKQTDIFFSSRVDSIQQLGDIHHIHTSSGENYTADFVVVDSGAHSLYLAHKMGHGTNYGSLPIAGSFYLGTKKVLNGKVYMVQNPKLPFAALHGDPDIFANGFTRFGPTALALPKLERYKGNSSIPEFIKALRFDHNVGKILFGLLSDGEIRNYIVRNFLFEVPYVGKELFLQDARKLIPSLQRSDIKYAKGFGGVRPQVLDKKNKRLLLGEASVNPGTGILFNMTPSPGATSCLGNAWRDAKMICKYLNLSCNETKFKEQIDKE
ncbi:MAG: malate:quinone oxidoreductase [Proteobacteria bacterium]|nr:MAG: malate:quinone oxidoreductase [Pseudomonadota bacterium]